MKVGLLRTLHVPDDLARAIENIADELVVGDFDRLPEADVFIAVGDLATDPVPSEIAVNLVWVEVGTQRQPFTLSVLPKVVLQWPLSEATLHANIELACHNKAVSETDFHDFLLPNMVGDAPAFLEMCELIRAYAPSELPVLIDGETGTGKELAARAIHYLSGRAHGPFVPVNCGALPDMLFENELFGHQAGAYTDAKSRSVGLVGQAEQGTLFLDEIEALSMHGQVSLLRFLQTKEYRALGGDKLLHADTRIVAAGNADFARLVADGGFREDLYYRLAVGRVHMPALRERPGDALLLANRKLAALRDTGDSTGRTALGASERRYVETHPWPGNVRQLENFVERFAIIGARAMQDEHSSTAGAAPPLRAGPTLAPLPGMRQAKAQAIEDFERAYLTTLLEQTHGNLSQAARLAHKERSAFGRLLKKHNIRRSNFTE